MPVRRLKYLSKVDESGKFMRSLTCELEYLDEENIVLIKKGDIAVWQYPLLYVFIVVILMFIIESGMSSFLHF